MSSSSATGGPTDEQLQKLFRKLDKDRSGYLDGDEVVVIVAKHFDRQVRPRQATSTICENLRPLTYSGPQVTEEEVAIAIEEMEAGGGAAVDTADGRVTFEEFRTWWRSNGPERLHARLRAKAMASERCSTPPWPPRPAVLPQLPLTSPAAVPPPRAESTTLQWAECWPSAASAAKSGPPATLRPQRRKRLRQS